MDKSEFDRKLLESLTQVDATAIEKKLMTKLLEFEMISDGKMKYDDYDLILDEVLNK